MKIIQAILSAFWLLTLVHGVFGVGVGGFLNAEGGDDGDKAAVAVGHEAPWFTITPPSLPTITAFSPDFGGTNNIYKTTPDVPSTPTETEASATPVDTAASTKVTANTAAITRPIDYPTAVITRPIDYPTAAIPDVVNTPVASETVDIWVVTTVSAYVTICPSPTTFTQGVQTYTITEATTLTISNCPCTISYPAPPTVATNPPSVTSIPVQPIGTAPVQPVGSVLTPSGSPIVVTNNTVTPIVNPPAVSFNSTRTTFIAVTAPPPHATQPLITLGGSTTVIPTPVAETPVPVPNTPVVPVLPTPTPATGGADRIFIGLGAAFLSGIVAVFL
ncbi:hypothetical protein VC83_08935 [Pseudogymnoascus destructans]|uniref:Uncharacterized protein n=2 Tax=Pseudogymnoascus destructans TaxID=655981 RepID=L8FNS4_PSED2|nr:uncharacterized protein VC83_08935 [Pseudogymnoascus destructans]ELR02557.1 hypothetical protein GMDG_01082 [Pseudogymnoascus destructans 20631-21]OAF54741.1 hypothetical protein VC83_08935 [Pseudogymnoascus destructans]